MISDLLRSSPWRAWTMASLLARMPVSMALLGVMLAVEDATGSLSTGSQVVGVMTITAGVLGPRTGRWLDRHDIRRALQARAVLLGIGLLAFAFGTSAGWPAWAFFAVSVFSGVTLAGVWGGFRALLLVVVPDSQRRHAHFVESLMIEITYGLGPLLVGAVIALINPTAALLVMAAFSISAAFALQRVHHYAPIAEHRLGAPWRHPAFAVIYAFGFFLGVAFGAIESNVAARMEPYGLDSSSAGLFLGLLALSSCVGGFWVSVRPMRVADPARAAAAMFFLFSLLVLPEALAANAALFAASLLIASLMLVPLNGLGAAEVEARTTPGQRAEAFAYLMAATQMGSGLGVALNGVIIALLPPRSVALLASALLAVMAVVMATIATLARRRGEALDVLPARSHEPTSDVA